MKKAVIVLPTYNEAKNIQLALESIFEVATSIPNWELHVAVVDSNSPDGTAHIVEEMEKRNPLLHLIKTPKEGLGKAYIRGFTEVIEKLNPFVIFEMDADLSHNPKDIPRFLEKITQGADFVIGSRYLKGGSIPSNWGLHRKIFSIGANWVIRLGFMRLKNTEWTNGYRAIKVWVIKKTMESIKNYSGYVFQVALLDNAIKSGARVEEIPINFVDRTEGVSKINSIQYILHTFLYVFTNSSFIKFVIVGLIGFVIDFGIAYALISSTSISKPVANMISAEMAIIANYFFNNFWSFQHKKVSGGIFTHIGKFLFFNLIALGSVLIQGGGLALALHFFGDHTTTLGLPVQSWILYKVFIIAFVIIPYSYVLYNKVIWKEK